MSTMVSSGVSSDRQKNNSAFLPAFSDLFVYQRHVCIRIDLILSMDNPVFRKDFF